MRWITVICKDHRLSTEAAREIEERARTSCIVKLKRDLSCSSSLTRASRQDSRDLTSASRYATPFVPPPACEQVVKLFLQKGSRKPKAAQLTVTLADVMSDMSTSGGAMCAPVRFSFPFLNSSVSVYDFLSMFCCLELPLPRVKGNTPNNTSTCRSQDKSSHRVKELCEEVSCST